MYQVYFMPKNSKSGDRGYTMFDIEYYMKQSDRTNEWYSEISCLPCVNGFGRFLKEILQDKSFDFETFIKESEEIQEIRGLLYEKYDNKPKEKEVASKFHYHIFGNILKEILDNFANKYNFFINID